ncbi:MAG: TSUP family transporter [Coriobacteriales bacterium]|nr:TSUP family transporter [Coriobacteriales bacterium]
MDLLAFFTSGLEPWALLIVCPLLFLAGLIDAIGGGGGLISVPAYMFTGLPVYQVLGTNKLSSCMGTSVSTAKYIRNGYVVWAYAIPCVVTAFAGSTLGASLTLMTDERVLLYFMLIALPVIAFYVLKSKNLGQGRVPFSRKRTAITAAAIAFVCGVYDGFYGPGAGTFMILLLDGVAHLDIYKSAGIAKVINLTTNIGALVTFLRNGCVLIGLGLLGGVFNIAGSYIGANLFKDKGAAIVRPVILIVLAVFAVRLILQLTGVL